MCALRVTGEHLEVLGGSGRGTTPRALARDAMPITEQPFVWVLRSSRAGDASQVLALAEALGWPFEVKRLEFRPLSVVVAPPFATSDAGLDRNRSDDLAPPWPDLVLA